MSDPPPLGAAAAAQQVARLLEQGRRVVEAVCVQGGAHGRPGARLLVADPGEGPPVAVGGLGEGGVDAAVVELARQLLGGDTTAAGLQAVGEGPARVFLELHEPTPELVIVGAGHIARPLCTVGALLGFRVVVLDDRPDFATRERFPESALVARVDFSDPFREVPLGASAHLVLVTRGHKYDYECLRQALAMDPGPGYVGMIGSRRRVRATFAQLLDEGVDRARLDRVRAPVGLDLGAQSPEEIAVAVGAEIVAIRRGGSGTPLADRERILQRFFPT